MVWCGVVWCGVVWCGVVWCGVVWCGKPHKDSVFFLTMQGLSQYVIKKLYTIFKLLGFVSAQR
jgi:hypothetical protein